MTTANLLRLILLAAIWGSSFLFMRISAPVLGPAVLIEYRVGLAAVFLAVAGFFLDKRLDLRANWKHYLMLGMFNSALPFLLFAFAARTLSASVLSVLNATAPMWGALIGAAWSRRRISGRTALGLCSAPAASRCWSASTPPRARARPWPSRRRWRAPSATASPAPTRPRRAASSRSPTRTAACGPPPCW
jgi:hypothetical protein